MSCKTNKIASAISLMSDVLSQELTCENYDNEDNREEEDDDEVDQGAIDFVTEQLEDIETLQAVVEDAVGFDHLSGGDDEDDDDDDDFYDYDEDDEDEDDEEEEDGDDGDDGDNGDDDDDDGDDVDDFYDYDDDEDDEDDEEEKEEDDGDDTEPTEEEKEEALLTAGEELTNQIEELEQDNKSLKEALRKVGTGLEDLETNAQNALNYLEDDDE